MTQPVFIASNIYRGSRYGSVHPLSIPRVSTAVDLSRALGWLPPEAFRTSPKAKPSALARWHAPDYLDALLAAEREGAVSDDVRRRYHIGTLSNPVFPEVFSRPATAAGGGLLAAELVRQGGVAFNPGGGTHHGMKDRASGFCYLNEPVLTILRLMEFGLSRIAYVDIDAHHGDGVEAAFADDPRVLVLSVHEENRWPFSGALTDRGCGNVVNLPVPRGFHDDDFAFVLDRLILPRVQAHRPEALYLQCGADAVTEDPLSRLCLSNNAHVRAVKALVPLAPRAIVSGGGGYNPWTVGRLWTRVWGALTGRNHPDRLPPEAEAIQRALTWHRKGGPAPALLTTLADDWRGGPVSPEVRSRVATLQGQPSSEITRRTAS